MRLSTRQLDEVLIETLWNVNFNNQLIYASSAGVLIETLWNVNVINVADCPGTDIVLIETLWNVNYQSNWGESGAVTSFNRNIVECKCELRDM